MNRIQHPNDAHVEQRRQRTQHQHHNRDDPRNQRRVIHQHILHQRAGHLAHNQILRILNRSIGQIYALVPGFERHASGVPGFDIRSRLTFCFIRRIVAQKQVFPVPHVVRGIDNAPAFIHHADVGPPVIGIESRLAVDRFRPVSHRNRVIAFVLNDERQNRTHDEKGFLAVPQAIARNRFARVQPFQRVRFDRLPP